MTKKNSTLERHAIPSRQRTVVPAICARWFADESGIIWSLPASLVIQAILFAAVAYWRLIDTDEGLYLLASKLVAHGKRPYFDFFYQQMPALPYVYAVWSKVAGLSWISGRMLSALFSVALGGLLYRHIERLYSRKTFACLGVLLYALNNLVIGWHPVVKTYALSNLFLFCAYIFLFHEDSQHKQYWPVKAFSSGALVAFAAETRLYLIVVAPVLMASLYWSGSRLHARFKSLGLFICGFALGMLPAVWFLSRTPDSFAFDNLGYHLIRSDSGLRAAIHQKVETILAITNMQGSYDGSGAQFAILSLLAAAVLLARNAERRLFLPFGVSLVLFVTCLLPSPTFPQYFCVCVPYMIIIAMSFIAILANAQGAPGMRLPFVRTLGILLAGLYALCGILALYNYSQRGTGVEGISRSENRFDYQLSTVRQVTKELDQLVGKGERAISFWPGYVVECDCIAEPDTENDFALWISPKLTPAEAAQRKIITRAGVKDLLERHDPRAVVIRSADWGGWGIPFRDALQRNGYKLVRTIGRAEIYWTTQK